MLLLPRVRGGAKVAARDGPAQLLRRLFPCDAVDVVQRGEALLGGICDGGPVKVNEAANALLVRVLEHITHGCGDSCQYAGQHW